MLRHIVSVGLAMTACATLISTKANAATLTVIPPDDEIAASPGDLIQFEFVFTPTPSRVATNLALIFSRDGSELSQIEPGILPPPENIAIRVPTRIANPTYRVLTPVKDGISDIGAILLYQEYQESDPSGTFTTNILEVKGADVVPAAVPEPLTIFGTVTALGLGTLFKQKSSKRRKVNH